MARLTLTRRSRQFGYGIEFTCYGPNREVDSIICAHCGRNEWQQQPGVDPNDLGARCTICDKFICRDCRGKGCMPFEYRLEQWERRGQGLRYDKREHLFDIFQKSNGKIVR